MTRRSEACFEVSAAATGLLHAMSAMGAEIPCQESRDALERAARVVGALSTWADAWGHAYAAERDDRPHARSMSDCPTIRTIRAEVSHA